MSVGSRTNNEVSEGPKRWERAKRNALKNPSSKGAKLYFKRYEVADQVLATVGPTNGFVVNRTDWHASEQSPPRVSRRGYVCSTHCAALQLQLETGDKLPMSMLASVLQAAASTAPSELHDTGVRGRWVSRLDRTYGLSRAVTCRVCGTGINPTHVVDKAAVEDIAAATVATEAKGKWYVTPDGRMFAAGELRVVKLTDDEAVILSEYSTNELRAVFAKDFGYLLAES